MPSTIPAHSASLASRSARLSKSSQARIDPDRALLAEDRDQLVTARGLRPRSAVGLAKQVTDELRLRQSASFGESVETLAVERRETKVRLARGHVSTV
jgi:hypothetical protein